MFNDDIAHAIVAAARKYGLEPACALAIVEVETGGKTFEADGRTPQFLYERHIAYREAKKRSEKLLASFQRAGLAIPKWSRSTQYKDQGTSAKRLALMNRACAIDPEVAMRSASWGLGQTMGFLAESIGFGSAAEMVKHQTGNVAGQIDCMMRELKRAGIIKALNEHNWARAAKLYNGAGYAANSYDTRLRDAYTRWNRKLPQLERPAPPEQSLAEDEIEDIQRKLRAQGFHEVGAPDGKWGTRTAGALAAFQAHHGLPVTGHYDKATQEALNEAEVPRAPAQERTTATVEDLRKAGSDTIKHADKISTLGRFKKWLGLGLVGGGTAEQTGWLDQAQDAADKAQQAKSLWDSFHDFVVPVFKWLDDPLIIVLGVLLLAAGIASVYVANRIRENRLADHQAGVHAGPEI